MKKEHTNNQLRRKNDSQRLAGLLLAAKFCQHKDDHQTIILNDIYHALPSTFLHGERKLNNDNANRDAYLSLALTLLASLVRVPQIAATQEMLAKLPLILELMSSKQSSSSDSYEFLLLVSTAHEDGVTTLYESGGMNVLSSLMPTLPDGSQMMELSMKLVKLITSKIPSEKVFAEHPSELSKMASLYAVLHSVPCHNWSTSIRVGIMAVLQNRVAPAEKFQALILAECVISIVGEEWLIGQMTLPDAHSSSPADLCILLVLESSRVEIAVILNELAYLKYEASTSSPPNAEGFLVKLRNLGVAFALVERIIKLISNFDENEEINSTSIISESTFSKIIGGLNETIGLVLDYLQDAKEHGQRKGDDLLASARIVGSYLAEAPIACQEVGELLGYMLSVEGEDELSPFYSISFLIPLLCQITMRREGCEIFASSGAFGTVVGYLIALIDSNSCKIENSSTTFLKEQIRFSFDNSSSVKLLQALACWTEDSVDPSVIMMASSICALLLDSTSEEALLGHPDFNSDNLIGLSQLMKRSLVICGQRFIPTAKQSPHASSLVGTDHLVALNYKIQEGDCDNTGSEADLHEIVMSGYSSWADRFPHIKQVVERCMPRNKADMKLC